MRWEGNVAHTEERSGACRVFWWGKLRERVHLEDLGIDWRIILKCVFSQ
jgi:hypothetical protein